MTKLREFLDSDLEAFFDSGEFATAHEVKGTDMLIIIDHDMLQMRKIKNSEGIYRGEILFHVPKSVYGDRSAIGQIITFGGKKKKVLDFEEDEGIYTITLEANRA